MTIANDVEPGPQRLAAAVTTVIIPRPATSPEDTAVVAEPESCTVLLPQISTDPLEDLVDRVRPMLGRAVDALQVAAALESDGFTDRGAKVEYGYADVFALATEVYRRLGPAMPATAGAKPADRRAWRDSLRVIAHGPLYVLPSAAFPAVMAVVGRRSLILGLVAASGLGWVYAGAIAHAAYRLLGFGQPASAARVLRVATLAAPIVGVALGAGVVALAGGGGALIAMVTCQLAYQLASTALVFYRREAWLAAAMAPAFAVGVAYLLAGTPLRSWAVAVAAGGVLAALVMAVLATIGRATIGRDTIGRAGDAAVAAEPPLAVALRPETPALVGVAVYGLCSAVLLLHAEAPYLLGRLDIAVAAAPLILAMGVVEWRAGRFRERAVALTRRVHRPREFVRGVWLMLAREAVACLLAPAALAALLLAGLWATHLLSAAGAVMTAAHVALGGAYFLAFLLAGLGRFGWLCASMLAALAVHVGVAAVLGVSPLLGQPASALADTSLYLGSVLLLQALFVLGLAPLIGQARRYR
jgi:hypothetical protein